jgi:hypothetical protein
MPAVACNDTSMSDSNFKQPLDVIAGLTGRSSIPETAEFH